mmetsp:Transcript_13484/g.23506  ORF Transcript_13484/g.23506 Transcript_13484/m.23506 type:complete len:418 (-) Transcript_13484:419-1672(-)
MGSSQSHLQQQQEQERAQPVFQSLTSILRPNEQGVVDWNLIRRSLQQAPEQACLYAQHVEPSQLFVALSRGCPVDVAQTLMDAYEDALEHNFQGQTVLHAACSVAEDGGDEQRQVIELLLSKRPQLASVGDGRHGMLPLHQCRSVGGAKVLLQAFPEGIAKRTRTCGSLPLHLVLLDALEQPLQGRETTQSNELNIELCRLLLESSSYRLAASGLLIRNKKGQTPLSLLIRHLDQKMNSEETVASSTSVMDEVWDLLLTDCLPRLMKHCNTTMELHTLIEHACCHSKALMDRALGDFSEQASQRDSLGRTPLHIAAHIGSCCSTEALEALIHANPKAPRMTDNEGRLPIDWAAESPDTPLKNLSLLIKGEPRAVDTRDLRDGHYPFVSAAISEHTSINNTYYLLRAKPHVLSYFHLP